MWCERNIEDIQKDYNGYREGVFIGHCMKCGNAYLVIDGTVAFGVIYEKIAQEEKAVQQLTLDLIKGLKGTDRSKAMESYREWRDEQRKMERREAQLERSRIYQRKMRFSMTAAGLCIQCGTVKEPGRATKRLCLECTKKKAKKFREKWRRHIKQGKCPSCGTQKEDKSFVLCEPCRKKVREYQLRRKRK